MWNRPYKSKHYIEPTDKELKIAKIKATLAGEAVRVLSDGLDPEKPFVDVVTKKRYSFKELIAIKEDGSRVKSFFEDQQTADRFVEELEKYVN